jgi:hypothetical protein
MTIVELAQKVKAVRDAQKVYFETRDRGDLATSKRLERALDRAIDVILGEAAFFGGGQEWADWNAGMLDFGD